MGGPLACERDRERGSRCGAYFGGVGVNPSRLRPGSGLGLGFGAFLTSFLPLSLLPMRASVTHEGRVGKDQKRFNLKGVSPNASPDLYAGFDRGSQARSSLLEDRESNPRDN